MEEHEKNIARIEKEYAMNDICQIRIELARHDEKLIAAADALKLAEGKVSRVNIMQIVTVLISVIALLIPLIQVFLVKH